MTETIIHSMGTEEIQSKAEVFCNDFPGITALAVFGAFILNGHGELKSWEMLSPKQQDSCNKFLKRKTVNAE